MAMLHTGANGGLWEARMLDASRHREYREAIAFRRIAFYEIHDYANHEIFTKSKLSICDSRSQRLRRSAWRIREKLPFACHRG